MGLFVYRPFLSYCKWEPSNFTTAKTRVADKGVNRVKVERQSQCSNTNYFFRFIYLFIFRQRGREGEREGEKSQCVVASHAPPAGHLGLQPRHIP